MYTVTCKIKLALCFTSAAVLLPKAACAQTDANVVSELDSLNSASRSELPLSPEHSTGTSLVEDTPVGIIEPEYSKDWAELEPEVDASVSGCTLDRVVQPEFTKVTDLEHKIPNLSACTPDNVAQPEFTSKPSQQQFGHAELETKHLSPTSYASHNLPLVAELDKPPNQEQPEKPKQNSSDDPNYIAPPRKSPKEKVDPLTTTLFLNGTVISHLTEGEFVVGVNFGNQNTIFDVNEIVKLNSENKKSLTRNNIFTLEQTGDYLQLQTVRQSREVEVSIKEPQTLLGTQIQLSLTASCTFPGTNPEDICTYTPGIATDRNSVDPDTLIPTNIFQASQVGKVVTPESLAAIKEPGFQTGVNNEGIGVDLFFPNAGSTPGNNQGNKILVTREELSENTPVAIYSRVRQIVKLNDREAVLGRTVRGFGFILNDENTLLNTILQLSNLALPDAIPKIKGSSQPANSNVNNNLFYAANNVRLPPNSFTIYHAGLGRAESLQGKVANLSQVPPAIFNGIWLGVTPVIERNFSAKTRYEITGPRITLFEDGEEGGPGSNVSVLSVINNESFSTGTLRNFYSQVYLKNFSQDVNYTTTFMSREETNYVPHISFTGDITGTKDIIRYYTGAFGVNKIQGYLGADFTRNTVKGWVFSGGAIAYVNPDKDYYSQVQGSVVKRIPLSQKANLIFSSGFNYALDREFQGRDFVNALTVGARINIGDVSMGLVNYFGDILPDSIENTLFLDLTVKFNDYFNITAYYTPINESSSRSRVGARAEFKLGNKYNSSTLTLSWTNSDYNLGTHPSGEGLGVTDNVFTVLLRFGEPANPFRVTKPAKRK
ncbi:hypothetical protein F7734_39295 [Scytonema sp. UIC 10036]|uniref:hypothetical protein n=1 Tax=Scytonema sp. UIC 10036 TaxID=2304196 RepID=UPI00137FC57F|nr:hypothetical protein [Scytonema sp. UIC 10036]MUG98037.1 hypothetical protein [Scytonema sp. UIC 10036]